MSLNLEWVVGKLVNSKVSVTVYCVVCLWQVLNSKGNDVPRSFSAFSGDHVDRIAVLRPQCTGSSDGEEMCTAAPAVRGA